MENKKKKQMILGIVAAVLVVLVVVGVYAGNKLSKIKKTDLEDKDLQVAEEVKDEYMNVALFGVNAVSKDNKKADSDAVYVLSLNKNTKEVKMLPVYGNTMMKSGGKDIKMKDAYAQGGAEKAIAVLNENFKLDIEKYVSVNFKAMVDTIDILGGIEIDVKEEEIPHINGYTQGIASIIGTTPKEVTAAGKQLLDGTQATAYCRIRVTEGGDVKRGKRQMEVIDKMIVKLKEAKFAQMDKIMDAVFPLVETNFKTEEMIAYGKDAAAYKLDKVDAFPRKIKKQVREEKKENVQFADYKEIVEAEDFAKDVQKVHEELFK